MYFDSFQAALSMDGHGAYVWVAYAITLTVLAWIVIAPRRRARNTLSQLADEARRQAGAAGTAKGEEVNT